MPSALQRTGLRVALAHVLPQSHIAGNDKTQAVYKLLNITLARPRNRGTLQIAASHYMSAPRSFKSVETLFSANSSQVLTRTLVLKMKTAPFQ